MITYFNELTLSILTDNNSAFVFDPSKTFPSHAKKEFSYHQGKPAYKIKHSFSCFTKYRKIVTGVLLEQSFPHEKLFYTILQQKYRSIYTQIIASPIGFKAKSVSFEKIARNQFYLNILLENPYLIDVL